MKSIKNLSFSLLAIGALLIAAACSSDDELLATVTQDDEAGDEEMCTLTFNLSTQGSAATRSATRSDDSEGSSDSSTSTATIGDGTTATQLKYGIYKVTTTTTTDDDGNSSTATTYTLSGASQTTGIDPEWSELSTSVDIALARGSSYVIVFWAESPNTPYTTTFSENTATMTYTNQSNLLANSDDYDAFYYVYSTDGPVTTGKQEVSVTLTRPFAQINFGTDDIDTYTGSGDGQLGYTLTHTKVVVSNVYTTMDLLTGEVSGDDTTVTFGYAAYPNSSDDAATGTFPYQPSSDDESSDDDDSSGDDSSSTTSATTYKYLAVCYVLLGTDRVTSNKITLYYSGTTGDSGTVTDETKHYLTVTNAPLQRNYRTNIYGSLLYGAYSMNVSKASDYDSSNDVNNDTRVEVSSSDEFISAASAGGGTIALTSDIKITSSITYSGDITIELNGHTLTSLCLNIAENSTVTIDGQVDGSTLKSTSYWAFEFKGNGATLHISNVDIIVQGSTTIVGPAGIYCPKNNCTIDLTDVNLSFGGTQTSSSTYAIVMNDSGGGYNLNLDGCTVEWPGYGIVMDETPSSANSVVVKNSTINTSGHSIFLANGTNGATSTLCVEGSKITSAETPIEVTKTNLTVTNSTLASSATSQYYWSPSKSYLSEGYGITLAGYTDGTSYEGTVSLTDVTYSLAASTAQDGSSAPWYVCKYDGTTNSNTDSSGNTLAGVKYDDDGATSSSAYGVSSSSE